MSKQYAQVTCPHCKTLIVVDCLVTDDYGNAQDRCSECGKVLAYKVEYIRTAKATKVSPVYE